MTDDLFRLLHTEKAGISSFPTSQGAVYRELVFTSGTGPLKPGGHEIETSSFRAQVEQTISNLGAVLAAGGSDFSHCVRVLVLLRSYDLFAEFNEVYASLMPKPYPPRMAFVTELVHPDVMVEMHAIGVAYKQPEA
jgi:2-iminobutanoate/2-iminopropanoate deaminase